MKKHAFIFTICSLLLISACQHQTQASREIEVYLNTRFGVPVNDSTLYCFFPANQCKNCFLYQAAYIRPEINAHTVIITGFGSGNFKDFRQVLHDGDNAMLDLEALDYGNRIVTFQNGNICLLLPVTDLYAQLDSAWGAMQKRPASP